MRLGLQPTEAWYTVYGEGPQILTGAVANDIATMRQILDGEDWRQLRERLLEHVHNYSQKVVSASGRFQLVARFPAARMSRPAGPQDPAGRLLFSGLSRTGPSRSSRR